MGRSPYGLGSKTLPHLKKKEVAMLYSSAWMYHRLSNYSPVRKDLGHFPSFAITSDAVMYDFMRKYYCIVGSLSSR